MATRLIYAEPGRFGGYAPLKATMAWGNLYLMTAAQVYAAMIQVPVAFTTEASVALRFNFITMPGWFGPLADPLNRQGLWRFIVSPVVDTAAASGAAVTTDNVLIQLDDGPGYGGVYAGYYDLDVTAPVTTAPVPSHLWVLCTRYAEVPEQGQPYLQVPWIHMLADSEEEVTP